MNIVSFNNVPKKNIINSLFNENKLDLFKFLMLKNAFFL